MDPYIKDILEKIKQENSEAYESGDFQTLFDSYNKRAPFKVASVATLQGFYNELDSLQVEDEKKNPVNNEPIDSLISGVDSPSESSEEQSPSQSIFEKHKDTTTKILDYIGDSEAVDNDYNSYQGSFIKDTPQYDFQSMSIAGVMDWQKKHSDKAVGRYQFKRKTLQDILEKTGLKDSDQFSPTNQDILATELLKRRGYEKYLNGEGWEDFSVGLAKEWAAIPLLMETNGKLAGESYYQGVGTNQARGNKEKLEKLLREGPVKAYTKYTQNYFERQNDQMMNELFSGITPDLLRNKTEEELEVELKKSFQHLGFNVRQAGQGNIDTVIISHPAIDNEFELNLDDLDTDLEFFDMAYDRPDEQLLVQKAKELKSFMRQASLEANPEVRYNAIFEQGPAPALMAMTNEILLNPKQVDAAKLRIQELTKTLQETPKHLPNPDGPFLLVNEQYQKIKKELSGAQSVLRTADKRKQQLTRTFDNLADKNGGLQELLKDPQFAQLFNQKASVGQINPRELRMPSIRIDGRLSSIETLRNMMLDTDMRGAVMDGKINVEIINDGTAFQRTVLQEPAKLMTKEAEDLMKKNTKASGVAGQVGWVMRSTFAPLAASIVDMTANVGEFIYDVAQWPGDAFDSVNRLIYGDADSETVANAYYDSAGEIYQSKFDSMRAFADKEIRSVVPETSGDLSSSESIAEFFQKGTVAGSESIPYMALFAINPTLGVGITGMATYGETLNQSRQYKSLAQEIMKTDGYVPDDLDEYLNISNWQMRSMALAKGGGEAALTAFFTAKYFKNLSNLAKPGMSSTQFREAAKAYRRGYVSNFMNQVPRAGMNETLEEGLIAVESMAVDELFGMKDYSAGDYFKGVYNAGLQSVFTTTPLATLGSMRQKNAARDLFQNQVFKTMFLRNAENNGLFNEKLAIDTKLGQLNKNKRTNQSLTDQSVALAKEIAIRENRVRTILSEAPIEKLADFVDAEVQIQKTLQNAKEASIEMTANQAREGTGISETDNTLKNVPSDIKTRTQARIKSLVEKQQKIMNDIDPQYQYNASNDVKIYIDSFIGAKSDSEETDEVIMHSTTDIDNVIAGDRLVTNKKAKESGTETLFDTPDQQGGENAVFFTSDPKWDMGNRNGKFYFSKNKMQEQLTPGRSEKEFELLSNGDVILSRENGLMGIEFVEGVDISDEIYSQPAIKGQEVEFSISNEEKIKKIDELDRQNSADYLLKRKAILEKAQKTADKFGVPVVITQHRGNYQMFESAGIESRIKDEVVYPKNATEQDYASFGQMIQDQVRMAPAENDQERKYRNAASILTGFRTAVSNKIPFQEGVETLGDDNHFSRAPQDVQNLIEYLSYVRDGDLNTKERTKLDDFVNKLIDIKENPSAFESIAISQMANELHGSMELLKQVRLGTPVDLENKKINPQTWLESLFTIKGYEFATTNHILSNIFKRSSMKQPLLTVSNNIDASIARNSKEGDLTRQSYNNLDHLSEKVNQKVYFKDENLLERHFMSFLGKYEDTGVEGLSKQESMITQFEAKKMRLQEHINEMAEDSSPKSLKDKQALYQKVYDKIVLNAQDYAAVETRSESFNKEGVEYLRSLFNQDTKKVYDFMKNFHGRVPTKFEKYLPTVYSNVGENKGAGEGFVTDYDATNTNFNRSTGTMKESSAQLGKPAGELNFENYENVLFDLLASGRMQMETMADIFKLKGFYESKGFESFFDLQATKGIGSRGEATDFTRMRDYLLATLQQKVDRVNKVSVNERKKNTVARNFARVGRTIAKIASAKRLSSVSMRPKQYYSATLAQLPNLNYKARTFMTKRILSFTFGQDGRTLSNDRNQQALLSASLTQGRTGKSKIQTEFLDNMAQETSKTILGKGVEKGFKGLDNVSEKLMDAFLAQTDRLAANNTFLAFYMDYEHRNNPETQKLSDKEFFEYAANNINKKAVAYADEQVGRSQTQSDEWNSLGVYGQGNSENKRTLANFLFLFGRFQNNRKVGIANDLSVLSDDFASSTDKANAGRRLASAAIEIGVFKALGPMFSMAFAKGMEDEIAGLLGWDEEIDEAAKIYEAYAGASGYEWMKKNQFSLNNYKRNISKEFSTSLFDGMSPLPVPQVASELMYSSLNKLSSELGGDPDLLNVYSPFARSIFDEERGPVTDIAIADGIFNNAGLYTLMAQDMIDVYQSLKYIQTNKFPPYMNLGKDRYVREYGQKAADVLSYTTLLNTIVPSADLNTFNRILRGKIERDYLTTRPNVEQKKIEQKPIVRKPKQQADKILRKRRLDDAIKKTLIND
jgi:hypothetical protein